MASRKTEQDYKSLAESIGLVWLGKEACSVNVSTRWLCTCGKEWMARYWDVARGKRCIECGIKKRAESKRLKPEKYHELARERGFEWLGPPVNSGNTSTEWHCPCGNKWHTSFNHIKGGRGCPECAKISRAEKLRLPLDDYYKLEEWGFKWLGPKVKDRGTPTNWECLRCGYNWPTALDVLKVSGCPNCSGVRPKTKEDYLSLGRENNLTWLGPEVSSVKKKTWWLCPARHRFDSTFDQIRRGSGCRYCSPTLAKTPDDYRAIAKDRNIEWLGPEVSRASQKTYWLCGSGHKFSMPYSGVQQGKGCRKCFFERIIEQQRMKPEGYHALASELGYEWLGLEVKTVKSRTEWQCEKDHRFFTNYDSLKVNRCCPKCRQSKGEQRVERLLKSLGVKYEYQKRFNDCRNINPLPFDFYVEIGESGLLIEVDGQLHFKKAHFLPDEEAGEALKRTQLNDGIKNRFAEQMGIPLLRIPYTQFKDLESIVIEEVRKYQKGALSPQSTNQAYQQFNFL